MNEVLFFVMAAAVIGISFYQGYKSGLAKNIKDSVKEYVFHLTVSKMTHDYIMQRAKNETIQFLKFLGEIEKVDVKKIKTPKLPTPEEIDKILK